LRANNTFRILALPALALALLPAAGRAAQQAPPDETPQEVPPQEAATAPAAVGPQGVVKKGMRVEFSVESAGAGSAGAAPVTEGEYAEVRFRVTDAETGAPVSGRRISPAAIASAATCRGCWASRPTSISTSTSS
jgi:hypothetical protein